MRPSLLSPVLLVPLTLAALLAPGCGSTDTNGSGSASTSSSSTTGTGTGGSGGMATGSGGAGGIATGSGGSGGTGGVPCTPDTCSTPGYACSNGACVADCRLPGANACAAGTVCDVGDQHPGQCVMPGDGCVITGPSVACGAGTCGPGTSCAPDGTCYPALPCTAMSCGGGTCFGQSCACARPAAACTPAPLGTLGQAGTLNDYKFSRCGTLASCDGGIFDLDFDPSCNAYGVTMISGTDYLRKITPAGTITEWAGVTNLNMGEVAALQGENGTFGGKIEEVSLSYICCASCGCIISGANGKPQGVAVLDAMAGTLPMKIPSTTFTSGVGPWGNTAIDTGPYGLSWGLDRVLYVGNVDANGEYYALDLKTQTKTLVKAFPKRVYASAPLDKYWMMVALEGGEVWLAPVAGVMAEPKPLITLPTHVTSLVRDPWSGRVYAELSDKSIVSFAADGTGLSAFQTAPAKGRITIAPDGYLYHLTLGYPTKAEIVRWELPTML
jgi:hypothetical protein